MSLLNIFGRIFQDIVGLRNNFPGGGNGEPPGKLDWGPWGFWHEDERSVMEKILQDKEGKITFHAYQEVAGDYLN